MIAVILAQIATRWGQALTLLALSVAVTAAAVSGPAYTVAVDRAAIENELAAAESTELVVSMPGISATAGEGQAGPPAPPAELSAYTEARGQLSAFTPVSSVTIQVQGLGEDTPPSEAHRLLARDGFCANVTYLAGRCPVGNREAALPAGLAEATGASPGDAVVLTPVRREEENWVPDGPPVSITLVGVFEPKDRNDPYWVLQDPLGNRGLTPAIVTNRITLATLQHGSELHYLDAILPASALTPERIPRLRRQLEAANQRLAEEDVLGGSFGTDLPQLLDRIEGHGDQARALLPIAIAPVVVLGWFVVYLAVGHGVSGRRDEVGVVALRGARWRTRALTVASESLLPLLAGVPAGVAVALLLVSLAGPGSVGPIAVDGTQLLAAGVAAAGTVAAALLALRRELATPVVQLLRQVPPRGRRVAVATVEVLVVALGVVAVADLRVFDGELSGVMVAAPVVVVLAVGVLATLAVRSLVDLVGRWSLRRGRLGPAMAALYLARRPGSARLLVVLVLVLGTLGFAVTSADVAAQGRVAEAERLLGASRALEVQEVDRSELLRAVRAVDPDGRYAMAVVAAPGTGADPPVVAVDATRLAQVAQWSDRYGDRGPAEIAELLRPPAPDSVMVGDGELTAELSPDPFTEDGAITVSLLLTSPTGSQVVARFGPVTESQRTYQTNVTGCEDGCRLTAVSVDGADSDADRVGVTVHALHHEDQDAIPPELLTDTDWWRSPEGGAPMQHLWAEVADDGLLLTHRGLQSAASSEILLVDAPYPLPVVTAGTQRGELLTNVDGQLIRFEAQASLAGLPGIGNSGILMDLEYAERHTAEPGSARLPQVWLADGAPAGIADQLAEEGLTITGDRTLDDLQASIERSGAAMALRFFQFVAGAAVLVGLGALALVVAVDRRTWSRGLHALRIQGVTERTTTAAAMWSYGGIVVASAVAGLLAAGAAWVAAGERLPLGVDESILTDWPQWLAVLAPWTLVVVLLLAAAVVAARGVAGHRGTRGTQEVG